MTIARDSALIPVFDPTTGTKIAEVADGGKPAVDRAVMRARETYHSGVWRKMVPAERAQIMWRAADLIASKADPLARIDSRNTGMPLPNTRNLVLAGAELLRYYAGWCTKIHGQSVDALSSGISGTPTSYHAYTLLEPLGVAGLITPWNGPLYCALMKLAPALSAGCSCVLKPAEETPLSALELERILEEAGVPAGVVNVVTGYGESTGAAITAHPDIDKVAFTGSTETGKAIVRAATGNLKRLTLELGGKSAAIIFADADLSKAIPGAALGIFANSGQVCTCTSRVYVHRGIYQQVVEGLALAARSIRLGGSDGDEVDMGPLISARQCERVAEIVKGGQRDGATLVSGGHRLDRPGFFFEPTIAIDATDDMRLMREEIFGPVGCVVPFDDEESAITAANNTEYGLAATIWTRDIGRAHRVAKQLQAGIVWINCQLATDLSMPMGGYKQSGWGHELGWKGIEAYLNSKSVYAEL
jgi:phenylacetaldehyde dehydrogenase